MKQQQERNRVTLLEQQVSGSFCTRALIVELWMSKNLFISYYFYFIELYFDIIYYNVVFLNTLMCRTSQYILKFC